MYCVSTSPLAPSDTLYKSGDTTTLSSLQQLFEEAPDGDPDATNLPSPSNPDPHSSEDPVPPKTTRRRKKKAQTVPAQPDDPLPTPTKSVRVKRKSKPKKTIPGTDGARYIPPFVHFQQTLIREKLKTMSDEEAVAVESHIEDSYANAIKLWEYPWLALAKSDKPGDGLESEYYRKYVLTTPTRSQHPSNMFTGMLIDSTTPSKSPAKRSPAKRHSERSFCGGVHRLCLALLIFSRTCTLPPL